MTLHKIRVAIGAIVLLLATGMYPQPDAAAQQRLPFSSGEKLRYTVGWRMVPAGDAELTLRREDSGTWKLTAKANSVGYVSSVYKVEDEYQSTFRVAPFCSNEIRKNINEGDRHREVTIQFDQRRRLALLRDQENKPNAPPARQEQSSIPGCVQDILSAVYYTRTQTLTVGQSFEIPINDGSRTVRIRVEVQAKEEIQTPVGRFLATRVEPDVFSGNLFKEKARMFIWFSDDAERLPVQMRAQMSFGTITALLSAVDRGEGGASEARP